jgi:putative ABC transport system ATP-binding protein
MTGEMAIELENIRFAWDSEVVLELDSFVVSKGEKLFVGGPSGCGKSSLLSLLAGVTLPSSGSVQLLGTDLSKMSDSQRDVFRADHIGYIFQMFNLIPFLSVLENVTLPLRFSKRRRGRVSDALAEGRRLLRHLGMEELTERRVIDLSVGQQQRVAAARALIGSPEIVLADEPTSALDAANADAFVDLLFQECDQAGSTLIFVSHDPSLAKRFDRTILLEGGRDESV